jgi:D-sedoheptulose 7-phosphate isomerase
MDYRSDVMGDLSATVELMRKAMADDDLLGAVSAASRAVVDCLNAGGKVLFAGNGGSAADAQHLAGEFVSRFNYDRAPLPAIALSTDTSILTAIGNDYGYEHVFSRQVKALGRSGDVFVAISTSGNSKNIVAACQAASDCGMTIVGLTGATGGKLKYLADIVIRVPSDSTPFIQQLHITLGHSMCAIAERAIFPLEKAATA